MDMLFHGGHRASSAEPGRRRTHLTFLAVILAAAWSALFSPASRSAAALMILSAIVSKRRTLAVRLADFSACAAAAAVQDSNVGGMTLNLLCGAWHTSATAHAGWQPINPLGA